MALTWEDKEKEIANINMMIAGHPYDEWKPNTDDIEYLKKIKKNLPGLKDEPGEDPVDVFKDGIQGELFGRNPNRWKLAGLDEFNSFMDRFKKGSPTPKYPSLNHHSPEAQRIILNTALRIRAL
jgi:hypothetical protein